MYRGAAALGQIIPRTKFGRSAFRGQANRFQAEKTLSAYAAEARVLGRINA
jgi:hypothetical protein